MRRLHCVWFVRLAKQPKCVRLTKVAIVWRLCTCMCCSSISNLKTLNLLKSYYQRQQMKWVCLQNSSIFQCWKVVFLEIYTIWIGGCVLCATQTSKFSFNLNWHLRFCFSISFVFVEWEKSKSVSIFPLWNLCARCTDERVLPHLEGHDQWICPNAHSSDWNDLTRKNKSQNSCLLF